MGGNNDQPWWQTLFDQKQPGIVQRTIKAIPQEIHDAPIGWSVAAAAIGIPASFALFRFMVGTRYPTAAHIPPQVFAKRQNIKGKVVFVGDSDNFRVYHTPGFGWGWLRTVPTAKQGRIDLLLRIGSSRSFTLLLRSQESDDSYSDGWSGCSRRCSFRHACSALFCRVKGMAHQDVIE
jgi:hypothetical protein